MLPLHSCIALNALFRPLSTEVDGMFFMVLCRAWSPYESTSRRDVGTLNKMIAAVSELKRGFPRQSVLHNLCHPSPEQQPTAPVEPFSPLDRQCSNSEEEFQDLELISPDPTSTLYFAILQSPFNCDPDSFIHSIIFPSANIVWQCPMLVANISALYDIV